MKFIKHLLIVLSLLTLFACKGDNDDLNIHIISDIHYAPSSLFEYTSSFKEVNDNSGSMKQVKYSEEILDAYIDEELNNTPDYILITGDMVYSGSCLNHSALVTKLDKLIENGIKILVIPGNHDFDSKPYIYQNDTYVDQDKLTKEEFINIYQKYGYHDAYSVDDNSLSYSYVLNDYNFIIMLDTLNVYGYTDGELKEETLTWIRQQLEYATNKRMNIIVAGHHNIFIHNEMFDYGYRLNNSEKLVALLKEYDVHLYLSGHMHIQDIKTENELTEILTESFAVYPHSYAELKINNNNYSYQVKQVDIETYYKDSLNLDLKSYNIYGKEFAIKCNINKFKENYADKIDNDKLDDFINLVSEMNLDYFMGNKIELSNDQIELLNSNNVSDYFKTIINEEDKLHIKGSLK